MSGETHSPQAAEAAIDLVRPRRYLRPIDETNLD
jgi:hypothetical protein